MTLTPLLKPMSLMSRKCVFTRSISKGGFQGSTCTNKCNTPKLPHPAVAIEKAYSALAFERHEDRKQNAQKTLPGHKTCEIHQPTRDGTATQEIADRDIRRGWLREPEHGRDVEERIE